MVSCNCEPQCLMFEEINLFFPNYLWFGTEQPNKMLTNYIIKMDYYGLRDIEFKFLVDRSNSV